MGYLLLTLGLLQLVVGLVYIARSRNSRSMLFYGLFMLGIASYVGANGFIQVGIASSIYEHLSWAGATFAVACIVPFSFNYPYLKKGSSTVLPLFLWPIILFIPGILFTTEFIGKSGHIIQGQGYKTDSGPMFWFLLLYFLVYWAMALYNIIASYKKTDGVLRRNTGLLILSIGVSLLVVTIFDVILPLIKPSQFGYIGSLFTAVWFGFTGYLILKK